MVASGISVTRWMRARLASWSARDKAVGLLCVAVVVMIGIALLQGQFAVVAILPAVAVFVLLYHAIWEVMVNGWRGFFEWLDRRRR